MPFPRQDSTAEMRLQLTTVSGSQGSAGLEQPSGIAWIRHLPWPLPRARAPVLLRERESTSAPASEPAPVLNLMKY